MDQQQHRQFAELFVRYQHRVYRFILSFVPRVTDAEDLFQQTCLTLWSRWDQFDPSRDFTRWACGIAYNHIRSFLRKRQPLTLGEDVIAELAERRLERQDLLDRLLEALAYCIDRLPAQQRQLVEECYGSETSIKNIADRSGRTPNALYKVLRAIRTALHDCVTRQLALGESL